MKKSILLVLSVSSLINAKSPKKMPTAVVAQTLQPTIKTDSNTQAHPASKENLEEVMRYIDQMALYAQPDVQEISKKLKAMVNAGNFFGALLYISAIMRVLQKDLGSLFSTNPQLQSNIMTTFAEFMKVNGPLLEKIKAQTVQVLLEGAEKGYQESMGNVAAEAAQSVA